VWAYMCSIKRNPNLQRQHEDDAGGSQIKRVIMESKQKRRNECMQLVRISNRNTVCEIRYSNSESKKHIDKKKEICAELILQGKQFLTEAIFENGGRADILVLDDFEVIEILSSETERAFEQKKDYYPRGLNIRSVRA